jgi:Uma2 family endonuclease
MYLSESWCTIGPMAAAAHKKTLTLDAYLVWEESQAERHEYVGGEVFAMVGVLRVHGEVVVNLTSALKVFLKGKPCRVYSESLKVRAGSDVFYPDVFVTCSPKDLTTERLFTEPKLIFEVQSESTGSYDRGIKFAHYRAIASLEEYVIVDPKARRVEVFRKQPDGVFGLHDYSEEKSMHCESLGFSMALEDVFDGVEP